MSGNSIEFGEEIKNKCQKMCSVRMHILSTDVYNTGRGLFERESIKLFACPIANSTSAFHFILECFSYIHAYYVCVFGTLFLI